MASTLLNEQGWHRDAIERQLAHGERDAVRTPNTCPSDGA
jgi:murein L,D-transpeptidase YcbB/YkuD